MRSVIAAVVVAFGALAFGIACLDKAPACAQEEPVVDAIPWSDSERSEYVWLDHDELDVECGSGTLSVERNGDQYDLTLHFESLPDDDGVTDSDTSVVTVDADTLEPFFVSRERFIAGDEESVTGEYDRAAEEIRVLEYSGPDDTEPRSIPRRLDEAVYYDNEASLFLWRTIPLEENLQLTYNAVLVNQGGTQREVSLRVRGKEEVTVPAGTFDAWRVDIHTEDVDQVVFIADTPERQLVYYDNSFQIFELTSYTR